MHVVLVTLDVRPERIEEFLTAIRTNARASLRDEPGCLRFDVHRVVGDPTKFVLYEIYRDEHAFTHEHRAAPHYAAWRAAATRCVIDGGHVNTYLAPAFPGDLADATSPEDAS
ncbi:putative quinol monooxygenase [Phycicoccus sonneratiae]|uniref:Antibiotic biosynthesis monooxygenase n=1 Tax=Phycicoccus sonneratiae TaxID=2807628 RepID=A0ABS2CQI5_9MICO|nr:putative quinol monooxygenase [Phycicoccus sonneraticus]MBM6402153.1 antibiotic biosynthesis monooxygenase [Phycicoccus sonneraticus]